MPPAPSETVYWKLPAVAPAVLPLVKLIVPFAFKVKPVIPTAPLTPVIVKASPSMSVSFASSALAAIVTAVLLETIILSPVPTGASLTAATATVTVAVLEVRLPSVTV